MKKLLISPAFLGLTILSACGGGEDGTSNTPPTSKFALMVNLTGAATAPITVTNITSKATIFKGTLTGSKTFRDLAAGSVLSVQSGTVNGYATPAIQNVTLDSDKSVTLAYKTQAISSPISGNSIQGTVTGAMFTPASVYLANADKVSFDNDGKIGSDRQLSLPLSKAPAPDGQFPLVPPAGTNCFFNGTFTANPEISVFTRLVVANDQGDFLGGISEPVVMGGTLTDSVVARVYSQGATTVNGSVNCYDSGFGLKYDLHLSPGWNAVEYQKIGNVNTLRDLGPQARSELRGVMAGAAVGVRLQPNEFNFTDDSSLTAEATFYQDGGFNGTVALSTNIPGLTVEPTTLVLAPLSTAAAQNLKSNYGLVQSLGLQPQGLETKLTFKYMGSQNFSGQFFELQVKDLAGQQVGQGNGFVSVNRPGITIRISEAHLELGAGSSLSIPIDLSSVGNFSGAVKVSATGLPVGLTAEPLTVNLTNYAQTALTLKADASLKPGTYPITVVAQGAGKRAEGVVTLVVPRPSVTLSFQGYGSYGELAIAQAEKRFITVDVQSQNGFSGSTTLQATGLPAGVTATPLTVQVKPKTITTVKLFLIASANAPLGTSEVEISSPDFVLRPQDSELRLRLIVRPARMPLGIDSLHGLAAGNEGVWVADRKYDSQLGYVTDIKHIVGGQVRANFRLAQQTNRLLALPDGSVLAISYDPSYYSPSKVYRITDAGVGAPLDHPRGLEYGVSDGQGLVWFVQKTELEYGQEDLKLALWNPMTGAITFVPTTEKLEASGQFSRSNDGRSLLYFPSAFSNVLKIDTVIRSISRTDLKASYASIGNDETIYLNDFGLLKRLNSDGSLTTFQFKSNISLIGIDNKNSDILWLEESNKIIKFNVADSKTMEIDTGSVSAVVLKEGGLAIFSQEYNDSTNRSDFFLTIIP